jgi:hypothetical protein
MDRIGEGRRKASEEEDEREDRGRVAFLGSRTKRDRGKKSILGNECSGGEGLPEEDEDDTDADGQMREGLSARGGIMATPRRMRDSGHN